MANGRNPTRRSARGGGGAAKFRMEVEFSSDIPQGLRNLQNVVLTKVMRSGAYAGAKVFYDGMREIVPVKSGVLYGAIYHWHDDKRSSHLQQVYAIGPNKQEARHWSWIEFGHYRYNRRSADGFWEKAKSDPTAKVSEPGIRDARVHDLPGALAHPVWVPGVPYARPTWEALKNVAIVKMRVRMGERLHELIS